MATESEVEDVRATTNRNGRLDGRPAWAASKPLSADIDSLQQTLAWTTGATLRSLTVKQDAEGWLVVLRADVNGRPMVHFTGARYWADALEVLVYEVCRGDMHWKPDRFFK